MKIEIEGKKKKINPIPNTLFFVSYTVRKKCVGGNVNN